MAGKLGKTVMRAGVGKAGAKKLSQGGSKYACGGKIKKLGKSK